MSKPRPKRDLNYRFTNVERLIQSLPTWPFIATVTVLITIASFWSDKETNLSSWRPPPGEVASKTLKVLIDNAETIAIVAAVVLYYKEATSRRDQRHYEAWQVIDNARGTETSYARFKALQDLNDDGVSLRGMDTPNADLERINLSGADLSGADLNNADLSDADLNGADLNNADLNSANLSSADLSYANLFLANLSGADLSYANLNGADLGDVNLSGANLSGADLGDANLNGADLNGADLSVANLNGADLNGADLNGADLRDADLSGADFPDRVIQNARLCRTKLPTVSKLNPNRDCSR